MGFILSEEKEICQKTCTIVACCSTLGTAMVCVNKCYERIAGSISELFGLWRGTDRWRWSKLEIDRSFQSTVNVAEDGVYSL